MTIDRIEVLVKSLKTETSSVELDSQTTIRLTEFESAMAPYLENEATEPNDSLLDKAKKLEIDFAQEHPTAEGIMQEIVATLGKMGI